MKTFRESGYIMLSIPREDVQPLDLLMKSDNGTIERLNSPLYELFIPSTYACPLISPDRELASDISNEETFNLKLQNDLGLLQSLINFIHSKVSASFSYNSNDTITLHLEDPKSNQVSYIQLDTFLQSATLNTAAAGTVEKLQNGELYVITETIKTKSCTISSGKTAHASATLNAEIKDIVAANNTVSTDKEKENTIQYSGDSFRTFGVKASRILYDKPGLFSHKKSIFKLQNAANIVLVKGGEEFPSEKLETPGGILAFI